MPTVTKSTVITSSTVPSNAMPLQIGVTPELWLDGADSSTLISDGAASFAAASSQRLSCASNSTLQTGNVNYWYTSWIYPTLLDLNVKQIIGNYNSALAGGGDFNLGYRSDFLRTSVWNSSGVVNSSSSGLKPVINTWNFYFVYSDSVNLYVSLNGGGFIQLGSTASALTSTNPFYIGGNPSIGHTDGKIDSCAFGKPTSGWLASNATALRDYLYNSGNGRRSSDFKSSSYYLNGNPSGAISWWDLDERSGTRNDKIGSNHLTDNNSVGYAAGIASGAVQYDGDPIKQWSDKSGNNRHLLAPSDSARPTYKTSQQNGRSAVLFDGTDDRVQLADASAIKALDNVTVFGVVKPTAAAAADTTTAGALIQLHDSGSTTFWYAATGVATSALTNETILAAVSSTGSFRLGATSANYTRSANTTQIWSSLLGSNGTRLYVNGSQITLNLSNGGGTSTASGPSQTTITSPILSHPFASGATGEQRTMELIVYPAILSTSQRQRIERYLAEKWMSPPTVTLVTSSSSQYLEWAAVDMAGSYKVYYRVNGTTAWTLALTTTSLYAVIPGLTVGIAYDFRVDAVWSV